MSRQKNFSIHPMFSKSACYTISSLTHMIEANLKRRNPKHDLAEVKVKLPKTFSPEKSP